VNYLVFSAYTVFPFIACSVAGIVGLWIQFQKGHIPVRVTATTIDPRSVLLDPIGAIFGSLWLLVTLILITGTGFAGSMLEDMSNCRCPGIYDFGSWSGFKSYF
jgi:hypothetical protein